MLESVLVLMLFVSLSTQLRRLLSTWDPLVDPTYAVAVLKRWRRHFLIDKDLEKLMNGMDIDEYGQPDQSNGGSSKRGNDRSMTAYETMMWTIWLPQVRSAIK